ncbi:MAG: hypothetical protein HC767_04585 [Akkermansiaceae bacterium]|nr:hypothetical protein [Akkermansiaceae bacterium]
MKEKLKITEFSLIGGWEMVDGIMSQDEVCSRIQWLTESCLREIAIDGDNWSGLYQDPQDKRYWELTYPKVICKVEVHLL